MANGISKQDVDEVLQDADGLIDSIGDQVTGQIIDETDSGSDVKGRNVRHGAQDYHIIASPEWPHVQLSATFDVAQAFAINRARTDGGVPGAAVQLDPSDIQQARDELISRVDDDELAEIRQGVIDRVSTGHYAANLVADGETVFGFQVTDRLYLYEEDMSAGEFRDAVQTLINVLWRTKEFLVKSYEVRVALDEGPPEGPRGYQ